MHHDIWDCDNVMAPVLADLAIDGRVRKVVVYGSKAGMFYILDRATGEAVHGVEERPVPQDARQMTWPTQPFPGGSPFVPEQFPSFGDATRPVPFYRRPILPRRGTGHHHLPGAVGGGDWAYHSFSPDTGYIYVGYGLIDSAYSNAQRPGHTPRPYGEYLAGGLAAVDPRTNTAVWREADVVAGARHRGLGHRRAGDVPGPPTGHSPRMDTPPATALWTLAMRRWRQHLPDRYEVETGSSTSPSWPAS